MSNPVNEVRVDEISTKNVNTRFGQKTTYSFKANGVWYGNGFKKPTFAKGDTISFEYEEDAYGKKVIENSLRTFGSGVPAAPAASESAAPRNASASSYGSKGVFPIPARDGQRSIVRQNALTNAREMVMATDFSGNYEMTVDLIISIARKFEAYTTGDLDMEAAKAAVAELTQTAAAVS